MGIPRASAFLMMLPWISSCAGSTTAGDGVVEAGANPTADGTTVDDAPGADGDSLSCAEKTRAASALLLAAETQDGTDLSCQTDDDCKIVWRITDCSDTCSTITTRTVEEKIKAAIEEANATVCLGFRAAGCKLITPPCAPPLPAACRGGMCSTTPLF